MVSLQSRSLLHVTGTEWLHEESITLRLRYTLQILTFVIAEASLVLTVVIYIIAILLLYYILQYIYFVFSSTLNACAGIKISRVTVYTINSW